MNLAEVLEYMDNGSKVDTIYFSEAAYAKAEEPKKYTVLEALPVSIFTTSRNL